MDGMGYAEAQYDWIWGLPAFFVVSAIAIFSVHWILRKILGVERKKWFTASEPFNDFHEKVERYFRYGSGTLYLVFLFLFGFETGSIYFFVAGFFLGGIQVIFAAYMEKIHADNPNDYKFTLLEYPVSMVIFLTSAAAFTPEIIELFMEELRLIFSY